MPLELPAAIAEYFAADRAGDARIAACFTEAAVVKDDGGIHRGREEIRRWKEETSAKFAYVSEPRAIDGTGDRIIVTSRVTGDFPGSPIDLRYAFALEGGLIAELEIAV